MATSLQNRTKFTWCLSTYGSILQNYGFNITGIRECPWGHNCNNAHNINEITIKKEIIRWYKRSQADINLLDIKENIIHVLNCDKDKIKNQKYKSKINYVKNMNIVELLNFWFDVTCYHRKISKMLKNGHSNFENYYKIKDVPNFYLNDEDIVWSLQRTLNVCEDHFCLKENHSSYYIKNICVGHHNCKKGVHRISDLACIDDLIKGSCDCPSKETVEIQKREIQSELDTINEVLEEKTEDTFVKVLSKKKRQVYLNRQRELNVKLAKLNERKYHYTEHGLICYNDRVKEKSLSEPKEIDLNLLGNTKVIKLKKK